MSYRLLVLFIALHAWIPFRKGAMSWVGTGHLCATTRRLSAPMFLAYKPLIRLRGRLSKSFLGSDTTIVTFEAKYFPFSWRKHLAILTPYIDRKVPRGSNVDRVSKDPNVRRMMPLSPKYLSTNFWQFNHAPKSAFIQTTHARGSNTSNRADIHTLLFEAVFFASYM